jgi:hypothetical protein
VLFLEDPRWVLYAVKGKLGKGEDLVPGTMLDLKSMQEAGEEIYNIPVSDEEMKNVVEESVVNVLAEECRFIIQGRGFSYSSNWVTVSSAPSPS